MDRVQRFLKENFSSHLELSKWVRNEKDIKFANSGGHIYIYMDKFVLFFLLHFYCSFVSRVQNCFVNLHLMHPWSWKFLEMEKNEKKYAKCLMTTKYLTSHFILGSAIGSVISSNLFIPYHLPKSTWAHGHQVVSSWKMKSFSFSQLKPPMVVFLFFPKPNALSNH